MDHGTPVEFRAALLSAAWKGSITTEEVVRAANKYQREWDLAGGSTPDLKIEVYQQDWIPGFAAFNDDGSIQEGTAHMALNIGSFLAAVHMKDLDKKDLPYVIAESLMHEVIHALEAWAGVEFNDERVEALIRKYQENYQGKAQGG